MTSSPPIPSVASLWGFFFRSVGWFVLSTAVWMQVSAWTSYPVAQLTHFTLNIGADYWVRSVHVEPGLIEADTRIAVKAFDPAGKRRDADLVVQSDPARYAYGLPLFIALMLASRSRQIGKRVFAGYGVLLLPQTFSLVLELLRQIVVTGGTASALVVDQWQMECIALGYGVGSLLLPTIAPVMLWLWFERDGFARVLWHGLIKAKGQLS